MKPDVKTIRTTLKGEPAIITAFQTPATSHSHQQVRTANTVADCEAEGIRHWVILEPTKGPRREARMPEHTFTHLTK